MLVHSHNRSSHLQPWYDFKGILRPSSDTAPHNIHSSVHQDLQTGRILVVEDESIVALDLRNTLRRSGHTVVAIAASGPEAINNARRHQPDVILMDIRLQGPMDGITAVEIINSELRIPVIYATAQADTATRRRADLTAPAGYLLKPIVKSEMLSLISIVLRGTYD